MRLVLLLLAVALAAGMLLYGMGAHASEWTFRESWRPVKASECGARISVNHNNATAYPWHSFCIY